jgi:hypothetical protein
VPAGRSRHFVQRIQGRYRYNPLGRLTHILYDDPAVTVTMTYDTGAGANLLGRLAAEAPGPPYLVFIWYSFFTGYALRSSETGAAWVQ